MFKFAIIHKQRHKGGAYAKRAYVMGRGVSRQLLRVLKKGLGEEVQFMKRFLFVLAVLVFATTLTAQVSTGNIYGKITDTEGNALPGVSVQRIRL